MPERKEFLTEQIVTYLGNKRSLLGFIDNAVQLVLRELNQQSIDVFDVFSGSGVVSRFLKQYSRNLYTNDLEDYCYTLNRCYLTNEADVNQRELEEYFTWVVTRLDQEPLMKDGFITRLYSPVDDNDIKANERVFYTRRNAQYIDTARTYIEDLPEPYKTLLLGPLLYEASVKNNTSGVFKGFYKNSHTHIGQFGGDGRNALQRILSDIQLRMPVFSNYNSNIHVLQGDSNIICHEVPRVDLAYIDPPYNQHPYGSNYFMLNLINNYIEPTNISAVSGIPRGWNKSNYNRRTEALRSMNALCRDINARYLLISYNSDGFIPYEEMVRMLENYGVVRVFDRNYNVFRASRNLHERDDIHVTEYLFLLRKEGH